MLETQSKWQTIVIWLWVAAAAGIAVRLLAGGNPYHNNVYLKVYAQAADAFQNGRSLYSEESGFRYPPLAAVLFVPFAACGPVLGSVLWRLVNFLALYGVALAARRALFPIRLSSREFGTFLFLLAFYNNTSLNNGQANPLILAALLWATLTFLRNEFAATAGATTLATVFKVYPLAYGFVLAALRPRLLRWLLPLLLVALLLPALMQSPAYLLGEYRALISMLGSEDRTQDLGNAYRDLRLVLASAGLVLPPMLFELGRIVTGASLAYLCWGLRRRGVAATRLMEYAFSLTICWFLLFGPATEKSTFGLIAASVTWPLIVAWRNRVRERSCLLAWAFVHALILLDQVPWGLSRAIQAEQPWTRCAQPVAVLLAALLLLKRARTDWRLAELNKRELLA